MNKIPLVTVTEGDNTITITPYVVNNRFHFNVSVSQHEIDSPPTEILHDSIDKAFNTLNRFLKDEYAQSIYQFPVSESDFKAESMMTPEAIENADE